MARKEQGLLIDLVDAPWWLSLVFLIAWGLGLRFGLPYLATDNPPLQIISTMWSPLWWTCFIFLAPMAGSLARKLRKRRIFERAQRIESIRSLSWKEFEELLGEAYRRSGYRVRENSGAGPDGGIDLVVSRQGRTYLVQAKQWKSYKVGVKVVREMLGLVVSENADGAIVITSGEFTTEALSYAKANPKVQLVAGDQLVGMIADIQAGAARLTHHEADQGFGRPTGEIVSNQDRNIEPIISVPRTCPSCGGELLSRTARKGARAGQRFWGCSNYPSCRHTE